MDQCSSTVAPRTGYSILHTDFTTAIVLFSDQIRKHQTRRHNRRQQQINLGTDLDNHPKLPGLSYQTTAKRARGRRADN